MRVPGLAVYQTNALPTVLSLQPKLTRSVLERIIIVVSLLPTMFHDRYFPTSTAHTINSYLPWKQFILRMNSSHRRHQRSFSKHSFPREAQCHLLVIIVLRTPFNFLSGFQFLLEYQSQRVPERSSYRPLGLVAGFCSQDKSMRETDLPEEGCYHCFSMRHKTAWSSHSVLGGGEGAWMRILIIKGLGEGERVPWDPIPPFSRGR